ncbi:MAG: hypothetical protein ACRDY1_00825 [Acidimicrobiales bacterium]
MTSPTLAPGRRLPLARRLAVPRADLWAVGALTAVTVLIFAIPAVFGHAMAPGDDAIQNFPLRVLAGRQLASGHLPTFDPYIWGGAPLLGGWNAGALYPFTFLFAVLPPTGAWVVNEIVVYVAAALGLYAFLRALPLRSVPSALGAATFSFAGAMDVHLAHFGLVAGMSWIPLILLAMLKLSRGTTAVERVWWVALIAAAGGLSILAGEPRAIDTVVIVSALYLLWLALRLGRRAFPFLVAVGMGAFLAGLIGAVQWLPGAIAVSTSQRSNDTFALFASGSLSPRWLLLLLVPGVLGGSGSFGTSAWFAGYNLPEALGYVGIVPVVGAFALLGTLRWRRPLPDWFAWWIIALIGGILAIGSFTPLGHVLAAIPLFGGQRLQSRNIAITDLALAVLLAYWADHILTGGRRGATSGRRSEGAARHSRLRRPLATVGAVRLLALPPLLAAGLLAVAGLVDPGWTARLLGVTGHGLVHAAAQRPLAVVAGVLIAATAALVFAAARLSRPRRAALVAVIVIVDLVAFNSTDVWRIAPNLGHGAAVPSSAYPAGTAAVTLNPVPSLGTTSRFAMYDPGGVVDTELQSLSMPDLNVLVNHFSVQGYSSIVYGPYAEATGSHAAEGRGRNALITSAVGDGTLDQLDATTLVTSPSYLVRPEEADEAARPAPASSPITPGSRKMVPGRISTWIFGESIRVGDISLPWTDGPGSPPGLSSWRVGLELPGGTTVWRQPAVSFTPTGFHLRLPVAQPAVGLRLEVSRGKGTAGPPVVETDDGTDLAVNGALGDALVSGWRFLGNLGPLAFFSNRHPVAPLTLRSVHGTALGSATVRARSGPVPEPTSATVASPNGVEVVRAVAMIPGWTARWTPSGGGTGRALVVHRVGLVQGVDTPAGRGVVTWTYNAPGVLPGLLITLVGLLFTAVVVGWALLRRPRRGGDPGDAMLRTAREPVPN